MDLVMLIGINEIQPVNHTTLHGAEANRRGPSGTVAKICDERFNLQGSEFWDHRFFADKDHNMFLKFDINS